MKNARLYFNCYHRRNHPQLRSQLFNGRESFQYSHEERNETNCMKNSCKFLRGVRRHKTKNHSNDEEAENCDVKIVPLVPEVDL